MSDDFEIWAECVGEGWRPLVRTLHKLLLQIDPEYTVGQVKEKFGALRYYYFPSFDHDSKEAFAMDRLVRFAEAMSLQICETCGDPGKSRNDLGWLLTLCDDHYHAERIRRGKV